MILFLFSRVLTVSIISSIRVSTDASLKISFLSPFRSFLEQIHKSYFEVLVLYLVLYRISQGLLCSVAGLWWEQIRLAVTDYMFTLMSRCLCLEGL